MSKESKHQREGKKKPIMSLKEKRAKKWEKKHQKAQQDIFHDTGSVE